MSVRESRLFRWVQSRFLPKLILWHLSLLLVVAGFGVSSYLSYVRVVDVPLTCAVNSVFSCEIVQNSSYSKLLGVPVAYLGVLSYLAIGSLLVLHQRVAALHADGLLILLGLVSIAFLFSMYLVYAQGVLLRRGAFGVFHMRSLSRSCLS